MLIITLPTFVFSLFIAGRLALILTGLYKSPLLTLFEKYGDEENYFFPLPRLLFWTGTLMFSGADVFNEMAFYVPSVVPIVGFLFMILGYGAVTLPPHLQQSLDAYPPFPLWYHRLREHTSREERRRIAYIWLRLPARTRLLLNSNDRAFFHWTDLIILATT